MGRPAIIPENDTIYSINEAAERTRFSPTTLRRAVRNGRLQALDRVSPKQQIRLRKRDLDKWMLDGHAVSKSSK